MLFYIKINKKPPTLKQFSFSKELFKLYKFRLIRYHHIRLAEDENGMSTATQSEGFILKAGLGWGGREVPGLEDDLPMLGVPVSRPEHPGDVVLWKPGRKPAMCKRSPSPALYTGPSTAPPSAHAGADPGAPPLTAAVQTFYPPRSLPGGPVLRWGEDTGVLAAGRPTDSSEDPAAGAARFGFQEADSPPCT